MTDVAIKSAQRREIVHFVADKKNNSRSLGLESSLLRRTHLVTKICA